MTGFLFGLILGATLTAATAHHLWTHWADDHHYRRVRLEATHVDILWRDKDHWERYARRWEYRATVARQHIGDLTIQLARARRRPRRSPIPTYGIHRARTP